MLEHVFETIKEANRPVSLQMLSHRLAIEQGALSGMLDLLVRKGKLNREQSAGAIDDAECGVIRCNSCVKEQSCPFIAKMPVMYTLKEVEPDGKKRI